MQKEYYGLVLSWNQATQEIKVVEGNPVYQKSVAVHELTVLTSIAEGQLLDATFGTFDELSLTFTAITEAIPMTEGSLNAFECPIPDIVFKNSGTYYVSFTLKMPVISTQGATAYKVLTTGVTSFTVNASIAQIAHNPISQDTADIIMEAVNKLSNRVSTLEEFILENAPVVSIQKVAPNAFTYTNSKDMISAPIVIEGGGSSALSANEASTLLIPDTAWQQINQNDATEGYKCVISAARHGQMRNGATAKDLWVSFGNKADDSISGAIQSYIVNDTGDITVTVKQKVNLVVRVWNGKGVAAIVKWGVNAPTKLSTIEWITIGGK